MQFSAINKVDHVEPEDVAQKDAPVTPSKRQRNTLKEDSNSPVAANGNNDTPTPTKKARAGKGTPSKRSGALGPIPTSYEEAGEEDRLLIKMKEVDGKPWTAIQNALEEMTGSKVGAGLSMRYSRMKANFVVFAKEDEDRLLQARNEVEKRLESEKWQRIADAIEAKGGNKYPSATIQKKLKELSKKANGGATGSLVDEE